MIADTYVAPGVPYDLIEGIRTVAIDSARGGYFISGACEVKVIFGTTEKCVRAAITGRWR